MADSLYIRIAKKETMVQQRAYWWPLIFEAMRRVNFQFYSAESADKKGSYFEEDQVKCTFQELWNVLYVGDSPILVFFWPTDTHIEPFRLDVSVQDTEDGEWHLDITLEDGFLESKKQERDVYRLNALLQAGFALYELCFPCSLRMYWDEIYWGKTYTDLLQVRTPAEGKPVEPLRLCEDYLQWKEKACIADQHIYIADPIPIHVWADRTRFVSVFSKTMTPDSDEDSENQ